MGNNDDGDVLQARSGAHPDGSVPATSYQRAPSTDDDYSRGNDDNRNDGALVSAAPSADNDKALGNFLVMAVLFSANHGCVVSCMALATSRLGSIGAWQSAIVFIAYSASSVLGATYTVKKLGARNALTLGMGSYCSYVVCFYLATVLEDETAIRTAAYLGATIGGAGAGCLWTAQGTYFGLAAAAHSSYLQRPIEEATAKLAGYFASVYLMMELLMRLLSSFLLEFDLASWGTIFG
jgi:hypothetical protein